MKRSITFVILFIPFILGSCKKEDSEYQNDFEQSHQAWLDFKNESNNSYTYSTVFGSWAGFATRTTITVEKGKIVKATLQIHYSPCPHYDSANRSGMDRKRQ